MIDYGLEPKLKEIFDYLSSKAKLAYKNIDMLSNETLSKNAFSSFFVRSYLENDFDKKIGTTKLFQYIFAYYKKSFYLYFFYIANFFIFRILFKKTTAIEENTVIVDTFLIVNKVIKEYFYKDSYFVGLDEFLKKHSKPYLYLFVFDGGVNPMKMLKVFYILKKQRIPFVCEFGLLGIVDLLALFLFLMRYPFGVLDFTLNLDENDKRDGLLKYSMLEGIKEPTFDRHARYVVGKRLACIVDGGGILVSWFENQTIDKNLYKGINSLAKKIYIIGAQPFLFAPLYMSAYVDENEAIIGAAPDKVLVNGTHYMPKSDTVRFEIGPSFRYKKVFEFKDERRANKNEIVVLLSYFEDNSRLLLNTLMDAKIDANIVIKAHPATPISYFADLIRPDYRIVDGDIYELAKTAKVVIACATGAMIEMAALGIPVIVVKGKDSFDYNPMINFGKGVLWHEAASKDELLTAIDTINSGIKDRNALEDIGKEYKEMFFCEPTEENIKKVFEL